MFKFDGLDKPTCYSAGDIESHWPSQGKCDLRDNLCMFVDKGMTVKEHTAKLIASSTFVMKNIVLKSDTLQDIAPYMFSLVSGSFDKEAGNYVLLTEQPWIDVEEYQAVMIRADRVFKYFSWAKRNKLKPSFAAFIEWNKPLFRTTDESIYRVMFERYKKLKAEKGRLKKQTLCERIHLSYKNSVREELVDFLYGIGCSKKHPMIQNYISDIYWYYAFLNNLVDASYSEREDFTIEFQELIEKRGWV